MASVPYKKQVFTISSLNGNSLNALNVNQLTKTPPKLNKPHPKKIKGKPANNFIANKKLSAKTVSHSESYTRTRGGMQKNPGLAAGLSAFLWGTGQIYSESLILGMYWLILQIVGLISLGLAWHNRAALMGWAQNHPNGETSLLLGGIFVIFLASFLWITNIRNAYKLASQEGRDKYEGVDNLAFLLLGSLFIPGMGQMLNGQPRKGSFFLIFSMLLHFFLFASLWIAILWPFLVEPTSIVAVEWVLLMLPFCVGFSLIALMVSLYDAVKVHLYPGMRESFWKRAKNTIQRRKMGISLPGEVSFFRLFTRQVAFLFVLTLLLHGGWHFFPRGFYAKNIRQVSQFFAARKMKVLPTMLNQSAEKVLEIPKPFDMYAQLKKSEVD